MAAVDLFRRELGKGNEKKMFILHGLFGMSDNWVSIGKHFASRYHVIIPDLRNHGQSPHTNDFGYAEMTEDLLLLFDKTNTSKAVVLGHSMGGKLAMNLAFEEPHKVDKLIVADMSMREGEFRANHAAIFETIVKTDIKSFRSFAEIQAHFESMLPEKRTVLFVMKNIKRGDDGIFRWKLNYEVIYNNIHKIMEELNPGAPFTGPALFIRGGRSDYIGDDDFAHIKEHFPMAVLETIEEASHWLHADNPKAFINIIDSFLNSGK